MEATPLVPREPPKSRAKSARAALALLASVVAVAGFAASPRRDGPNARAALSGLASNASALSGNRSDNVSAALGGGNLSSAEGLSHTDILTYLDGATGNSVECTVRSALCSSAVCTLNSDKLTANCGCLSMDRDANNPATLDIGWGSFIMAKSTLYQAALQDIDDYGAVRTDTADELCAAVEDGSLWTDLATGASEGGRGWGGKIASTSMYSTDTYFDDANPEVGGVVCTNAVSASCMGAPCFQIEYDGVYDQTCICPVIGFGVSTPFTQVENKQDGHICDTVSSEKMSCAASSTGSLSDLSWSELEEYVDAILDADPKQSDAVQCPSTGVTWFEHESSDRRVNATDNRQELNVSHVLERNSTHSRGDANTSNRTHHR